MVTFREERVILMSKNKPEAAIVSLEDVKLIEDRSIMKRLSHKGIVSDSGLSLKKMREERIEQLSSSTGY